MAYIAPNTTVTLMKGVPLSNDYQHTLWFDSAAAQQTYFQSCTKKTYTALSYQRYENGMIQLLPGRDGVEGFFIARLRRKG